MNWRTQAYTKIILSKKIGLLYDIDFELSNTIHPLAIIFVYKIRNQASRFYISQVASQSAPRINSQSVTRQASASYFSMSKMIELLHLMGAH